MYVSVISIDALIESDLKHFESLPNMGRLLSKAAIVPKIMSIYPTYTYPCHASIMTGCYPNKTGLFHNYDRKTGDWKWYRDAIKVPLMTDYVDVKTAAVMWPVLGGADIDILVPEIWADGEFEDSDERFRSAASPKGFDFYKRHKDKLCWMRTPAMDNFAASVYADIIKEEKPGLSFLHLSYLDHQRHNCGAESENVLHAISFIDEKMGEVLSAFESAGIFDDTLFVVLGDHGHRNFTKNFYLQEAIDRKGYGDRIHCYTVSLSSQIYINDIDEKEAFEVLSQIALDNPGTIDRIFTKKELIDNYNLDGEFSFEVEAADSVAFKDSKSEILLENIKRASSHGFLPEKGPFSPLIFSGFNVECSNLECRIVDIAPTILLLFGKTPKMDGKSIKLKFSY